jgi:hypothetical protein
LDAGGQRNTRGFGDGYQGCGVARPAATAAAATAATLGIGVGRAAVARKGALFAVAVDGGILGHVRGGHGGERGTARHVFARFGFLGLGLGRGRDAERGPAAQAARGLLGQFAQLFFLLGSGERLARPRPPRRRRFLPLAARSGRGDGRRAARPGSNRRRRCRAP